MALNAGTRLGPYEVVAPLGAGGMGEVYRAHDPRLGREVAVKVLPVAFTQDAERLRRFELEARAVGALNHPHILALYDTGSHEGMPYVVTELLDGQTLRDRLASGALPVRKAVEIAVQIARGLVAAHEKGIVHRDLKPENLFLTRGGHVKILDFGLAKLAQPFAEEGALETATRGTNPGTVMGTAGYMSPEQVRALPVDHRSDLFSLGAVLYEMLSGRRAFKRDTQADTLAAILNEEPPELTSVNASLPPALERIVRHCLEKNRDERFSSARDLAFDLESLSDASSSPIKTRATPRKRRLAYGAGALLFWTAAVGATAWFIGHNRETSFPSYRPLTFRRGTVTGARFSPDGTYVFYSAAWKGGYAHVYSTRFDVPGEQDLGLDGNLVAVAAGEVFVRRPDKVLIRASLTGAGAHEVANDVDGADVSADGSRIVVVRHTGGHDRVESPPGKVIYESTGDISDPRLSPKGDRVVFSEATNPDTIPARLALLDFDGRLQPLTETGFNMNPVWSTADEIWFSGPGNVLSAVTTGGRQRVLLPAAQPNVIHDLRADGRSLLAIRDSGAAAVRGLLAGMDAEGEFFQLDGPQCFEITNDGRALVLSTLNTVAAASFNVYLGDFGDAPPVRLGRGFAGGLSPDGRMLAVLGKLFTNVSLLPTGPGTGRELPKGTITDYFDARYMPDGRALLIAGSEAGRRRRIFLQDLDGGLPRPITPEGVTALYSLPSPDGMWVVAGEDWEEIPAQLYPIHGGTPRPIPGLVKGEEPLRLDADGTHLFIRTDRQDQARARVERLDLRTGRKELWKELGPPDPAGVNLIQFVYPAANGKQYVYNYEHSLWTLYLAEGLR
jgi:Tol biopolymer transport system component